MRAAKIWSQVEATFKQMDTAGTEYECFQALQRQEKLAASNRINSIWEDVQKQKELEKTLQNRYGDLLAEKERIYNLMEKYREEAKKQEEIAANLQDTRMAETESEPQVPEQVEEANPTDELSEMTNQASTDLGGDSVAVDNVNGESSNEQRDDDPSEGSLDTNVQEAVAHMDAVEPGNDGDSSQQTETPVQPVDHPAVDVREINSEADCIQTNVLKVDEN